MNGRVAIASAAETAGEAIANRVAGLDWPRIETEIERHGAATAGPLLNPETCAALIAAYDEEERFRSRVIMARHGFGQGEYRYFAYPLPDPVAALRQALYPHLARIAMGWQEGNAPYPPALEDFLARCHRAGQRRPTPLLLKYGPGDYNCLHQDLYGELVFPLQATILLSRPGEDFSGGEFVLVEQRPRRQSRAEVVLLRQGEAVIFAVNRRPVPGARGRYSVAMRHGVSRLRSGGRFTLGVIFHDAA